MSADQSSFTALCALLLVTLLSCNTSTESYPDWVYRPEINVASQPVSQGKQDRTLTLIDTIRIPVDSVSLTRAVLPDVQILNGDTIFSTYNGFLKTIDIYSLNRENQIKRVQLAQSGPNRVLLTEDFYVHNLDSIFVLGSRPNILYLINDQGDLLRRWDLNIAPTLNNYAVSSENMMYKLYYDDQTKSVGFWLYPSLESSQRAYFGSITAAEYSLVGDSITHLFGSHPSNYLEPGNIFFLTEMMFAYHTPKHHVHYFASSHDVLVYDRASKNLVHSLEIKSEHFPSYLPPLMEVGSPEPDGLEQRDYVTTQPLYLTMLSNARGTWHYRFAKHPIAATLPNGDARIFDDREFSVIILDEGFNHRQEIEFENSNQFDFTMSFAVGNALYISMNTEFNALNSEDYITFAKFINQPK